MPVPHTADATEDPVPAGSSAVPAPDHAPSATATSRRRRGGRGRRRRTVALALALAVLIAAVLRGTVADVYWVGSESMEPTLQGGDRVLVNKLADPDELERGQLVVFDGRGSLDPLHAQGPWYERAAGTLGRWLGVSGSATAYVKRVMAVGGDTISCCDASGRLTVNGHALDEPYVYPGDRPSEIEFTVHVPEGRVWLMGDHRAKSVDSRSLLGGPGGGLIRTERVIGTVHAVIWPLPRAGTVD